MIVLDASVWVKLLLPNRGEAGTRQAVRLWEALETGTEPLAQPAHWLAEILAVLSRLSPTTAQRDCELLHALEIPTIDSAEVYRRAVKLATDTGHHLFDTLYHAVALCSERGLLVTADASYYEAARHLGGITMLDGQDP